MLENKAEKKKHLTSLCSFRLVKALEKLKRQLAEADAALEERKKPAEDTGLKIIGEGLVIDEWVSYTFHLQLKSCNSFSQRFMFHNPDFFFLICAL